MKTLSNVFLFALIAGLFAACADNPVGHDHEEHALTDIHRLELVLNGEEVVVIEDNAFADGDADTIHVHGETALITLNATTEEGEEIHFDELGEEYSLRFSQLDTDIAEIEQHEGERWSFHIVGKEIGTTPLVLEFVHINHPDYETPSDPSIIVEVVEVGGGGNHDHNVVAGE